MQPEGLLFTYAGLACWVLSTQRLRRELKMHDKAFTLLPRFFGVILLAISAGWAVQEYGPEQGTVAAIGMLSAVGLLLVLILSRWPKPAVMLGAVAFIGGGAVSIIRVLSV